MTTLIGQGRRQQEPRVIHRPTPPTPLPPFVRSCWASATSRDSRVLPKGSTGGFPSSLRTWQSESAEGGSASRVSSGRS